MEKLRQNCGEALVRGTKISEKTTTLDPCSVFKGKLAAAAFRDKYTDAADLLFLATRFEQYLTERSGQFNSTLAGLAMEW